MCVTVPNLIKIGQTIAEIWQFIGTTQDDHLMVSIVVQNLVEMDAVVSIT